MENAKSISKENAIGRDYLFHFLGIAAVSCLLIRGAKSFFYAPSITAVLWNEEILLQVLPFLGLTYSEYLELPAVNAIIHSFPYFLATGLTLCGLDVLRVYLANLQRKDDELINQKLHSVAAYFGSFLIATICFLGFLSKGYKTAILIEWMIQISTPILFLLYLKHGVTYRLKRTIEIVTAFTFLGHGLFAGGFGYDVPGHFIDMTIGALAVEEKTARVFLFMIGLIDVAIFLALMFRIHIKSLLMWTVIWGGLTALSRVYTGTELTSLHSFAYWGVETLVRLPHMLVPLTLYYMIYHVPGKRHTKERSSMGLSKAAL